MTLFFCITGGVWSSHSAVAEDPSENTYHLQPAQRAGQMQAVKVVVEVAGQLKLNPDGKHVTEMPLKVAGELVYDEKLLPTAAPNRKPRSVRHYREAKAEIVAGKHQRQPQLSRDRRLIVVQQQSSSALLFSPLGPLTRDELELLEVPGNSLAVSQLLPTKPVRIGDSWKHSDDLVAWLLDVDAVSQNDLRSTLRQVDKQLAVIELEGTMSGAVSGVATEIEVKAKYNFDTAAGRVTWLAMGLKEKRSIGHAEPGFEVTARVRMVLSPLAEESPELSDGLLEGLPLQAADGAQLLSFHAQEGGFSLLHDRRWRVMIDRADGSILRMVDRGDLLAQCNLSRLPNLPAGRRIQLQEFQADIQQTLGENFRQFIEATQSETDDQIQVLRVVAEGIASEIPVRWVYYHLGDDQGQRLGLVFTLENALVERFAAIDQALVGTIEFRDRPEPTQATAAKADGGVQRN